MTTFLTLAQAGLPTPDTRVLEHLSTRLGTSMAVYGGYVRDLVALGNTTATGDIDAALSIEAFLALKPPDPALPDYRRHFSLHEPHLLFMLHQDKDGVFAANERPYVLALKPEHQAAWGLGTPLGLTLTREPVPATALVADVDLGLSEAVWDGTQIMVSPAFVHDLAHHTFTLRRVRDARDYARTLRRVERFTIGRYADWTYVVPPEFEARIASFSA